ncbi:putative Zn finger protein [Streptomyces sp. B3I7]|uniref:SWIM zinc finger family protein n=1 Tax=Streptomyces sp. B3I7 TaxID=3042269 RepID=UPI0027828456|nr:SWIM zinc finger family protein [Streptomyces sp. B3I7]MDQ0810378.1 putative Zn finger protein [Streptomyces sp. B3I7]
MTEETPNAPAPRPGDAARKALREARARAPRPPEPGKPTAAGEPTEAGKPPEAGTSSGTGKSPGTGTPRPTRPTAKPARPGDIARRALRAARAEATPPTVPHDAPAPLRGAGNGAPSPDAPAPAGTPTPSSSPASEPDGTPLRGAGSRATNPRAPAPVNAPNPPPAPEPPAPTTPRTPHSMAAPTRDGDLRRTFPPSAPRATDANGDPVATTWWGNAWLTALEAGALDAARLARGRAYAAQGHVDAITVTPGQALAYVRGSRPRPYRTQVRLRTLSDADWDRFLDAAVEHTGHIAALLDKEMPHSLSDCGVPLLPGPGDLEPLCSCPDRGHPCKHAAALCYQTARLLDEDPFVLLLLRGRGEREILDALSRRSAAHAARAAQDAHDTAALPGVRARDAVTPRTLPPLPAPLPPPPHPEQPPAHPAAPGGPDPLALDQLATDAAARAHALLTTGRDPVAELTLWQDAVRLAAARPGSGLTASTRAVYASLASATGRTTADLARAVAAWRQGGLEGLAVLEEPWDPPAGRFDRARPLLLAADLPAFRPWRNRLTHPVGHVQLRLGRDHLWYAYESDPGADDWWPRGIPDLDPIGALTGLGGIP